MSPFKAIPVRRFGYIRPPLITVFLVVYTVSVPVLLWWLCCMPDPRSNPAPGTHWIPLRALWMGSRYSEVPMVADPISSSPSSLSSAASVAESPEKAGPLADAMLPERSLLSDLRDMVVLASVGHGDLPSGPVQSLFARPPTLFKPFPNPWRPPIQIHFRFRDQSTGKVAAFKGAFNPSVLPLPARFPHRYIGVARISENVTDFEGREVESVGACIWCFLKPTFRYNHYWPETLECVHPPQRLHLNVSMTTDAPVGMQLFRGIEDARLFWDPNNEPLMIYGQNSLLPNMERTMWMCDLRFLIPELGSVSTAPIDFPPTEFVLAISDRSYVRQVTMSSMSLEEYVDFQQFLRHEHYGVISVEKNWSPLVANGRLLLQYSVSPRKIFSLTSQFMEPTVEAVQGQGIIRRLRELSNVAGAETACASRTPFLFEGAHQSTNMIRLALCSDVECSKRHVDESVYFQIVHNKVHRLAYHHYGMLWLNEASQFRLLAVTPRLDLPNTISSDSQRFILSLNYELDRSMVSFDVGCLDSIVAVSFGLHDRTTEIAFVRVGNLLYDLIVCDDSTT